MTTALTTTTDRRSARAQRTRLAVVEALLDMLREGHLRPTGREIAARAGVSLRSLYVHFDDLDDLYETAAVAHFRRHRHLLAPIEAGLPIEERIRRFVEQRSRLFEATDGVRQAAEFWASTSPALTRVVRAARDAGWDEVRHVFGDAAGGDERVLHAVYVAGGPATWDSLRRDRGLEVAEARSVVRRLIGAALRIPGGEP